MGSSQSVEIPGGGTEGYHVLRVQDNSPGQKAGLEAFFDFIVAIGNTRLDQDNDTLKELLKSNKEKEINVTVYSSKTQNIRVTKITPSELWGGQGLLGVSIRFCSFEGANENVWHILEVCPASPAEVAGLRSFSDYIIGADSILHESEDLFTLIETHENKQLKLYVYNCDEDRCREVVITPNSQWGGEGSLGAGIGFGYLHRIPIRIFESPESKPLLQPQTQASATNIVNSNIAPNPTINPPQPIPFIPMVPPLASTFSPPVVPSVTSALVDNLINNNPTPISSSISSPIVGVVQNNNIDANATLPAQSTTTIVSPSSTITPTVEKNANIQTVNPASALFANDQQSVSQNLINVEQSQTISTSNAVSKAEETMTPAAAAIINQSFVNSESLPVPMYNMTQFQNPIQAPVMNFPMQQQLPQQTAFAPIPFANQTDQNSNHQNFQLQQQQQQQQFPATHYNVSPPQMPATLETYPQVQTQINLAGMPPLVVNTKPIDPAQYQ